MNTLTKKINAVINDAEESYIYLTSDELDTLLKRRGVKHFAMQASIDRYIEEGGSEYYPSFGTISITRGQAKELAKGFRERSTKDGKELLAKVYISQWAELGLYISL
jgi:ABC-type xylose transport system substrate-binding protein